STDRTNTVLFKRSLIAFCVPSIGSLLNVMRRISAFLVIEPLSPRGMLSRRGVFQYGNFSGEVTLRFFYARLNRRGNLPSENTGRMVNASCFRHSEASTFRSRPKICVCCISWWIDRYSRDL